MQTLSEVGADWNKIIFVLNKSDLVSNQEIIEKVKILNLAENKKWISVSALAEKKMDELKILIKDVIENKNFLNSNRNKVKETNDPYGI